MQELKAIDIVNNKEITTLKNINNQNKKYIYYQQVFIKKQDSIIAFQKESIDGLVEIVERQNRDIIKQRSKTFLVGLAGFCSTIFLSYIYLKK